MAKLVAEKTGIGLNPSSAAEAAVQEALAAVQQSDASAMRRFEQSSAQPLYGWVESALALDRELARTPRLVRFRRLASHVAPFGRLWRVELTGFQEEEYEVTGALQVTRGQVTYVVDLDLSGSGAVIEGIRAEYIDRRTPDSGTEEGENKERPSELGPHILWTWNGAAAAKYSDDWAERINPGYREYPNDCTNFASQCLLAGGKDQVGSLINRPNDDVWFYGALESTTSYTWAGAQNLYRHLVLHTNSTLENLLALRPGDIILLKPPGANPQWHAMIVGARSANDALMNYHSSFTYRRSFLQIKQGLQPGTTIYYCKIGNGYQASVTTA
ncbi:amidase domain-containing protein [Bradyrhizobium sp. AUGA SZCCT0042]|uniref:amidase domain-containing protein n=1 Tax=Bradyrhizobium sp. AUGA SZCCT0042 TaxID=2807651 RepID=UPI001BAD8062|nr:amidase domain-containing protein [Bradyrhizobium sp. AUGA SZCCT0042]MBR1300655.1 amidase domain-containing protein [Bradyrhizobium sp. AUGA SZCCT0042]